MMKFMLQRETDASQSDKCELSVYCVNENPYLFADCPPLKEGPQRKGKASDADVETVKERHFIRLNLPYALSC